MACDPCRNAPFRPGAEHDRVTRPGHRNLLGESSLPAGPGMLSLVQRVSRRALTPMRSDLLTAAAGWPGRATGGTHRTPSTVRMFRPVRHEGWRSPGGLAGKDAVCEAGKEPS